MVKIQNPVPHKILAHDWCAVLTKYLPLIICHLLLLGHSVVDMISICPKWRSGAALMHTDNSAILCGHKSMINISVFVNQQASKQTNKLQRFSLN